MCGRAAFDCGGTSLDSSVLKRDVRESSFRRQGPDLVTLRTQRLRNTISEDQWRSVFFYFCFASFLCDLRDLLFQSRFFEQKVAKGAKEEREGRKEGRTDGSDAGIDAV